MAKKSKKDTASEYLESLLAHVPEEKRADVKAAIMQDEVLNDLGEKILMRDEFSRAMDEARAVQTQANYDKDRYTQTYEKNLKWYSDNEKALAQFDTLKKKGVDIDKLISGDTSAGGNGGNGGTQAAADLSNYVKKDEVASLAALEAQKIVGAREAQYAGFVTTLQDISNRHLAYYKEPLDTTVLVETARKQNRPLSDVYKDMTSDLAEQRAKEIEKKKQADFETLVNQKVAEQMSQRAPYPLGTDSEPSTLAGLGSKDGVGVEAATRAWLQTQVK